jgi:hypothetical protein
MPRKPELESVVALVISLAAVGMTVAALLVPVPEPQGTAVAATAPGAGAAGQRRYPAGPIAGGKPGWLARPATAAGTLDASTWPSPPARPARPRTCALASIRQHVRQPAVHRLVEPAREAWGARPEAAGGLVGSKSALPLGDGAAGHCGE